MHITTTETSRIVHDYDFTFTSGHLLQFTIDEKAGDSISFSDRFIVVRLAEKEVGGRKLAAEDITIFTDKLITYTHHERELVKNPEVDAQWIETINELTSTRH